MSTDITSIERQGIYPRFPKVKSYLKSFELGLTNWETDDLPNLERYSAEGQFKCQNSADGGEDSYTIFDADGDLTRVSNALGWYAIQSALKDEAGWLPLWQRSVAYMYWAQTIEYFKQKWIRSEFLQGNRPQYLPVLEIQDYGMCIGNCLTQGWLDWAINLSRRGFELLDIKGFNDGGDSFGRRRTQHFVLRLVANWQGWPERNSPNCAYDEPLFNALIEHWRTDDLAAIEHLLLAACDRHTHQARQDNAKGEFFDFAGGSGNSFYVPFEILSVLRLRQTLGLPNPELDHPLINTPLGKLPEPSEPYTDELLEGVIARACDEFPELCEGTPIKPATPQPKKPAERSSLLNRLFGKIDRPCP